MRRAITHPALILMTALLLTPMAARAGAPEMPMKESHKLKVAEAKPKTHHHHVHAARKETVKKAAAK